MTKIKIVNKSKNALPEYATIMSAGLDLRADFSNESKDVADATLIDRGEVKTISIKPGARRLIKTGLFIALPIGKEAQIRPRSGLAIKKGVTVLNSPGTIDADYRGEIGVIIINHSNEDVTIEDGERICQMVITNYDQAEWEEVETLDETERGEGGFGHTGKN